MSRPAEIYVLLVESRYYPEIADALAEGAIAALTAAGARFDRIEAPGALEIPIAIELAHRGATRGSARAYDGFVALGCVIRGETTHYDIVAGESARGLMDLGLREALAIGNGILTVEDDAQAFARARRTEKDKGGDAARACLALIALKRRLGVQ